MYSSTSTFSILRMYLDFMLQSIPPPNRDGYVSGNVCSNHTRTNTRTSPLSNSTSTILASNCSLSKTPSLELPIHHSIFIN
jgi:hypothetical protein